MQLLRREEYFSFEFEEVNVSNDRYDILNNNENKDFCDCQLHFVGRNVPIVIYKSFTF